jgi:hypothetical protein
MTGEIRCTRTTGGTIIATGGETLLFGWLDCQDDLGPSTAGHGVIVEFTIRDAWPIRRAVNIRRADRFALTKGANRADY